MSQLDDINTLAETAAYLRLKEAKVAQMAREGRIAAIKEGRSWIFPREGIRAYVERNAPLIAATGQAPAAPVKPRRGGREF